MTINRKAERRAAVARDVALRVFGNTSVNARAIAKRHLGWDGDDLVVLAPNGRPAVMFRGAQLVPADLEFLVDRLRQHYFDGDHSMLVPFKAATAILGLPNRELADLIKVGRGPPPFQEGRKIYFRRGDLLALRD